MKAMLFAAGLGTRLKPFTDNAPKALAKVGEKTLLELNILYLQQFGISDVIINVHHFASMIRDVLNENNGFGSNVTISDETDEVLETGGGLKKASWYFESDPAFVVMNVDILTNRDLDKVIATHLSANALGTLAVMKRDTSRYLLFDDEFTLCGWRNNKTNEEKISHPTTSLHPFAFSGIQVLANKIWRDIPFSGKFSLIDLYLHVAKSQIIKGYDHTGDQFIDVGKPESIEKAKLLFM